jgi:hypothetical protein
MRAEDRLRARYGLRIPSILSVVRELVEPGYGLAFVPAVVREYGAPIREAHADLIAAARRGDIELRPESGMGRLSAEELALCVPGPAGSDSVLSWARPLR